MTQVCIIRINSTINNTIITVVTKTNDIISIRTQGNSVKNLRGKRAVKHGGLLLGESLGNHLLHKKYSKCIIYYKGFGKGRESSLRGLLSTGIKVLQFIDNTQIPHNGCRPCRKRRI